MKNKKTKIKIKNFFKKQKNQKFFLAA